ncbi:hypothetical protein L7F22_045423 [Adiantum nelumboides]|nr:hypothetical protein [Adiantum nelumboides]
MNEEAHDAAQGMIGEIFVLKADRPLYCGREILAREEEFLLIGVVAKDIEKPKKYGFLHRAYKYKLIGDVLYMLGADMPELRKTTLAYDVFEKWGIDVVGPLPITNRGKNYILTPVDYLSRWAEAKAVRQITPKDVAKFVYEEICCKFGVPLELLSDQGPRFQAELLDFLCEKMKITRKFTTPYYPQCNGLNERFNGELVQILSKVTEHQGKNWDLEVPSALWPYRTAVKTGTGFTPFHLGKINKKIKDKGIEKGDLVLRYNSKLDKTFQKKFQVKWEGPFKVVNTFANGTYQLADLDGTPHASRVNGLRLKIYHARLMMVSNDEEPDEEVMPDKKDTFFYAKGVQMLFAAADHE